MSPSPARSGASRAPNEILIAEHGLVARYQVARIHVGGVPMGIVVQVLAAHPARIVFQTKLMLMITLLLAQVAVLATTGATAALWLMLLPTAGVLVLMYPRIDQNHPSQVTATLEMPAESDDEHIRMAVRRVAVDRLIAQPALDAEEDSSTHR